MATFDLREVLREWRSGSVVGDAVKVQTQRGVGGGEASFGISAEAAAQLVLQDRRVDAHAASRCPVGGRSEAEPPEDFSRDQSETMRIQGVARRVQGDP